MLVTEFDRERDECFDKVDNGRSGEQDLVLILCFVPAPETSVGRRGRREACCKLDRAWGNTAGGEGGGRLANWAPPPPPEWGGGGGGGGG